MRTSLPILVLVLAVMGCSGGSTVPTTPTAAQISEFVRNAMITLPASAQPMGWREMRGMDDALWLQVKMPAADLPSFLASSPFRSTTFSNHSHVVHSFDEFFTTPPVRYRAGQELLPNARCLNMVIDESDAKNVVVYMMWHET